MMVDYEDVKEDFARKDARIAELEEKLNRKSFYVVTARNNRCAYVVGVFSEFEDAICAEHHEKEAHKDVSAEAVLFVVDTYKGCEISELEEWKSPVYHLSQYTHTNS